MKELKSSVKLILPDVVVSAIRQIRKRFQRNKYRPFKGTHYPPAKGKSLVIQAKQHFGQAASVPDSREITPSKRWLAYLEKMRSDIDKLKKVSDVIYYSQSKTGFDHRGIAIDELPYFQLYEETLKSEFPHCLDLISKMGDSPYSRPETLSREGGRIVSNIFFFHLRYVLQCLTYVKEPKIVCEIGGGYGGLARLWLQNSVHRPSTYILIDFPESLFFAEVFLQVNFNELKLLYVTDPEPLDPGVVLQYSVILCPIKYVEAVSGLSLDLVMNTGSMQEMTEEWVDFWMEWLRKQHCRYFYSMNYFGQPLAYMAEGANTWSPRLTSDWVVRLQRFDPAFVKQYTTRNLAEILAEKSSVKSSINKETLQYRYELTQDRFLDGQTLLEAMDIIRLTQSEETIWNLLQRCMTEISTIPKEAYYLAEHLAEHATSAFQSQRGEQLQNLRSQLHLVRSKGQENVV